MADPTTTSPIVQVCDGGNGSAPRLGAERSAAGSVELARALIEVRELVETFRSHHLILDGWAQTFREAVGAMTAFERRQAGTPPILTGVVTNLEAVLRLGWDDAQLLDSVSAELAELLPAVVPADVPHPDDERTWVF